MRIIPMIALVAMVVALPPLGLSGAERPQGKPGVESWAAIAAFARNDKSGGYASIGYSRRSGTRSQVEMAAINQCTEQLRGSGPCKIVAVWQKGCRYAAIGHRSAIAVSDSGSPSQQYVVGGTPAEVWAACDEKRLTCRPPIGGCS